MLGIDDMHDYFRDLWTHMIFFWSGVILKYNYVSAAYVAMESSHMERQYYLIKHRYPQVVNKFYFSNYH